MPDNCTPFRDAILCGSLIAVSDGSCQDTYGTSAWVLQAPTHRLLGKNICPGTADNQNSYRSEIAGLLSNLTMVEALVTFFHIPSGSIEVACDGLSALNRIFSTVSTPSVDEPCYDLLTCARRLWGSSPLTWKHHHVKGHQDCHSPPSQLDIYSCLNIEMDAAAKLHLQVARYTPWHYYKIHEPWSIWTYGIKLNGLLDDRVHEIAHATAARAYWQKKCNLPHRKHDITLCENY